MKKASYPKNKSLTWDQYIKNVALPADQAEHAAWGDLAYEGKTIAAHHHVQIICHQVPEARDRKTLELDLLQAPPIEASTDPLVELATYGAHFIPVFPSH